MNTKTLAKVNQFGKVGKVLMTVLLIVTILGTILCGISAIYTATLPKDAVEVMVTSQAEFKINESTFSSVWNMLTDNFAYTTDQDPADMLKDNGSQTQPPEQTKLNGELKFFHQTYSSATIHFGGDEKIIEAVSLPAEYRSSDLCTLLVFGTLFAASVAVSLLMLRRLFKVLAVCTSPFCTDFVEKLRAFGYSLLPVAVFASIGETLAVRFLSAGGDVNICVQWGILITFAVTMCLVTVFRYGVQLQKESDETL